MIVGGPVGSDKMPQGTACPVQETPAELSAEASNAVGERVPPQVGNTKVFVDVAQFLPYVALMESNVYGRFVQHPSPEGLALAVDQLGLC
jgi:hypothetical protein